MNLVFCRGHVVLLRDRLHDVIYQNRARPENYQKRPTTFGPVPYLKSQSLEASEVFLIWRRHQPHSACEIVYSVSS